MFSNSAIEFILIEFISNMPNMPIIMVNIININAYCHMKNSTIKRVTAPDAIMPSLNVKYVIGIEELNIFLSV